MATGGSDMRQSLIDSIGRESALKLMGEAVLQAIKGNDSSGGFRKAKTTQVVDGPLCVVEDACQIPHVAGPSPVSRSLSKQVPIA